MFSSTMKVKSTTTGLATVNPIENKVQKGDIQYKGCLGV
jgi:hypothetical protein